MARRLATLDGLELKIRSTVGRERAPAGRRGHRWRGWGSGPPSPRSWGASGWFVVTLDPLVTLDGSAASCPEPEETTAGRIVAAGGTRRGPRSVSVTDGEAVRSLFRELADEHGGLDAVVNVAGITRQTYFGTGDRGGLARRPWPCTSTAICNVLDAALPADGRRRIRPVSSASPPVRGGEQPTRVCVQLRQTGGRRAHLAAGPTGATGGHRQRHVAHRPLPG